MKTPAKTPASAKGKCFSFLFDKDNSNNNNKELNNEVKLALFKAKLDKEIEFFSNKIKSFTQIERINSTSGFWNNDEISLKCPIIKNLALILLNINSSSAFIERFYSICGVVCTTRNAQMTDELVIIRCLLKVNLHLIEELTKLEKI